MKQKEKNELSRQRILESALREFADKGYAGSSVNTICSEGNISKGILYHYYRDKDALYLACVQVCFDSLTAFLRGALADRTPTLEQYFDARLSFFEAHPDMQRLFCDAVITPPQHLLAQISAAREALNELNFSTLKGLLDGQKLRKDMTVEEIIDSYRMYQDFVNARFSMEGQEAKELLRHDSASRRAVDIFLYGVVERE